MAAPHSQDAITATVVRTHACSPRAVLGTSLYSTNISTQLSVPVCVCFLLYHRIEANEKKHSLTLYPHNNHENNNHNPIFSPHLKKGTNPPALVSFTCDIKYGPPSHTNVRVCRCRATLFGPLCLRVCMPILF